MPVYFELGDFSRSITTSNASAQLWFDRGLNWTYGFHHEEAIACYTKALTYDPQCVMALWGIAHASGPNYNKQWSDLEEDERVFCINAASKLDKLLSLIHI